MEIPNVFEVQTLKDSRWMIEQRCRNEEEAVTETRGLFDSLHFQSVKVVRVAFDQAAKLYRETIVFNLPNGNGDPGDPMLSEPKEKTESALKTVVKRRIVKPQNCSLLDFFRVWRISRWVRAAPALLLHSFT